MGKSKTARSSTRNVLADYKRMRNTKSTLITTAAAKAAAAKTGIDKLKGAGLKDISRGTPHANVAPSIALLQKWGPPLHERKIPVPIYAQSERCKQQLQNIHVHARALQQMHIAKDPSLLKGYGLTAANPNELEHLGAQAPISNADYSDTPQSQGGRNLGHGEPGFEKTIFEPEIKIANLFENVQEVKVPAAIRHPGTSNDAIYINIPQQAPAFMDVHTLCLEYDIQLFDGNAVIANDLQATTIPESAYISLINNLAHSMWKDISFQINNQNLSLNSINYAFGAHMNILLFSEQDKDVNGQFLDQLFFFEESGQLSNAQTTPATAAGAAASSLNKKTLFFFKTLLQGQKLKCRIYPRSTPFCSTNTLYSLANVTQITATRNTQDFYMKTADIQYDPGAAAAKITHHEQVKTVARRLKLSIGNFQCRFNKYELTQPHLEKYIQSYTMDHPDTYLFTHQEIRTIAINPAAQVIQSPLNLDSIPDLIIVTLRDKQAVVGAYDRNPFEMFPIPQNAQRTGFKIAIKINNQMWNADPIDSNSEAFFRIVQALYGKMRVPLVPRHTIEDNDTRPPNLFNAAKGTTGYPFYPFALTFMGRGADGNRYEDRRTGNIELFCQLDAGATWNANHQWMIHAFSTRNYAISNEGQLTKNFL
eukprot:Seg3562.14 transcript_id=Seg3562.14/GoldUCD/mRNA.D3Y31 product="hypothetical protein" protein_id=Seg3562.14/GoldUCD/D3Y31